LVSKSEVILITVSCFSHREASGSALYLDMMSPFSSSPALN
jgi:hypothetical protein